MTATSTPQCACGRPIGDQAYLCKRCTTVLAEALGDIGALAEDLDITRTRQSRTGGPASGVTSRDRERPLPWDERASEATVALRTTVTTWVQLVTTERGTRPPGVSLERMSRFLLGQLEWLRHHAGAQQAQTDLVAAVWHAQHVIDRRADRLYVGPCDTTGEWHQAEDGWTGDLIGPCNTDLYAKPGEPKATCDRCGHTWDVAGRRGYLLDAAQDRLVTASDLSRFLSVYGQPIEAERIWKWRERGHLSTKGTDVSGRPLYRVGDAIALLSRLGDTRKRAAS